MGPKDGIGGRPDEVRYAPWNGLPLTAPICPACANRRHRTVYSITSSASANNVGEMSSASTSAVLRLMTSAAVEIRIEVCRQRKSARTAREQGSYRQPAVM
jgi:hypothetical protein